MKMKYIYTFKLLWLITIIYTFSSCKKTFDIPQKDVLDIENAYQDLNDADVAVMGVYAKFMYLAEQQILLNELRGDLVEPTEFAEQHILDISAHNVKINNPYTQANTYYEVIINCNDVIANLQKMEQQNRIEPLEAEHRIADLTLLRSWIYLQLGIQYGQVPYFTDPMAQLADLDRPELYKRLPFEALLDKLIVLCESFSAPLKQGYPLASSLHYTLDGYATNKFFVLRKYVLAELHLWRGHYLEAAKYYKEIMNIGNTLGSRSGSTANLVDDVDFDVYRISDQSYNINYFRGVFNWKNIFQNAYGEVSSNQEIIWNLPFDNKFAPANPFQKWFSGAQSLVRPSQAILKNWSEQMNIDNEPGDRRALNNSYALIGGKPVVTKFNLSVAGNILNPNAKWVLVRASNVHLKFAEAANQLDRNRLAFALVNSGIINTFSAKMTNDVPPFDFDARDGSGYRKTWYRNAGIRGRSGMAALKIDSLKYYDLSVSPRLLIDRDALVKDIDRMILAEGARENAFEGGRWSDLLRVALRREKELAGSGLQLLNDIIAHKYALSGQTGFVPKTAIQEFYLPFQWQK